MWSIQIAANSAEILWSLEPRPSTVLKPIGEKFWWQPCTDTLIRRESDRYVIYDRKTRHRITDTDTLKAARLHLTTLPDRIKNDWQ